MTTRVVPLVNGEIYHVINRGVEARTVFLQRRDFQRFVNLLDYYKETRQRKFSNAPKNELPPGRWKQENLKLAEIICYCLMPNHFHLLLRQLAGSGISKFLSLIQNSYTKFFNIKYKRIGPLFQGTFKASHITNDEQLVHVSRYIHLNPVVAELIAEPGDYNWSSYTEYVTDKSDKLVNSKTVLSLFKSGKEYKKFVLDHVDYAKTLAKIKHQTLEI